VINIVNAYKLEVVRTRIAEPAAPVNSTAEVAQRYSHLQRLDREHLIRLDLDNRNRIIGEETVSIGTAGAAIVTAREVFRGALLAGATRAIIIVHNHPSGDPQPSEEDRQVHEKLAEAGQILGIPVVDFIVIGEEGKYWSVSQERG
jgi:DNA repair protein RadC